MGNRQTICTDTGWKFRTIGHYSVQWHTILADAICTGAVKPGLIFMHYTVCLSQSNYELSSISSRLHSYIHVRSCYNCSEKEHTNCVTLLCSN